MLENFRTYQLALKLHRECEALRVPAYLSDQLLRASSSIVLNIAEGSGKPTPKEQARFYGIALGSLRETQAILEVARNHSPALLRLADSLGGHLYVLSHRPKVPA